LWNTLAGKACSRQARGRGRQRLLRRLEVETLDERACPSGSALSLTAAGEAGVPLLVGNGATPLLVIGGPVSPLAAGTPATFEVTAHDASGHIDPWYTGTVHFTSSDPKAVLPADLTLSAIDQGSYEITATLNTVGTQSLTATDTATRGIGGSLTGIVVNPAPSTATRLVVAGPAAVIAGTAGTFTVTAEDAGNIVTGYTGTVHFTSTDPRAGLPADYTFTAADHGTHTFRATFHTVRTAWLTGTDTATQGLTGSTGAIAVYPTPAAAVVLGILGLPPSLDAGTAVTFRVTADGLDGVFPGYRGTVHFTSSDPRAELPADYTFTAADRGTHTFRVILNTAGYQSVTATDTARHGSTATQSGILVVVGAANAVPAITGLSKSVVAPGSAAVTLTITGTDFLPTSVVHLGSNPLATTFVSGTELQVILPPAGLTAAGSFSVTVVNPAPGGGTSKPVTLTVSGPALKPGSAQKVMATDGVAFSNLPLALFTDPAGPRAVSTYQAIIDWGDGTNPKHPDTSVGKVKWDARHKVFQVLGSHKYRYGKNGLYTVKVTVHHAGVIPDLIFTLPVRVKKAARKK
jgi:hypothetical protein